ncbi:TonB family protein [Caulobacter sp.]|uniref:energy transducer TonB family protein n=1 Tax=Caulobacter sp. TaxID=78 RepID=UPI002B46F308|nr:TonB family protein [Caulobacter sp.]HJV42362.1 TonB family protein [Caulobacter sp.]
MASPLSLAAGQGGVQQWCRQVLLPKGLAFVSSCGIVAAQLALVTLEPFQRPVAPTPPDIVVSLVSFDDMPRVRPPVLKPTPSPERKPRPVAETTQSAKPDRAKAASAVLPSSATPSQAEPTTAASAPQPRPAADPSPPPAAALAVRAPTRDDALCHYQEHIWRMIMARRPAGVHLRGQAQLGFRLTRDGTPLDVKVIRTSGDPMLDRLAIDTVKRAAPFPEPPTGVASDTIFEIRFQFK